VRKRQGSKQEAVLEQLKKTYSEYKLTNILTLARLREPKIFPYSNKIRIYNEVSKKIIQSFNDIQVAYSTLPLSYRNKIVANPAFHRLFTDEIFPSLRKKEQKKKSTEESNDYESFIIYQTMFSIGLEGLIKNMPTGFQNYLSNQIKPLMQLMESITFFYRNTTGKKDIPYPYQIPESIDYLM